MEFINQLGAQFTYSSVTCMWFSLLATLASGELFQVKQFFYTTIMCALETRQPYLKYQKGICSHTLQWMISTSTFNLLVLFSLENRYLQALLLLNLLGMNYRSVGLMKAQKSLEHLTRTNVFIAVYYRTPLLQRMIQTLSWLFLSTLVIQLKLHTLKLDDIYKIYSLFLCNIAFPFFVAQTLIHFIEGTIFWKDESQKTKAS